MSTDNTNQAATEQVPANSLGIDDAEKLFAEAFKKNYTPPETRVETVQPPVEATKEVEPVEAVKEDTPVKEVVTEALKTEATPVATKKEEAVQETEKKTDSPYAWIGELPEGVRQKVEQEITRARALEHRIKSDDGRVAASQRQTFALQRELAELRGKIQKPLDPALAAAANHDASKNLEEWNTLVEADPGLGKAVEAKVAAEMAATRAAFEQRLSQTVNPLYQQSEDEYKSSQLRQLADAVPNYQAVLNSPEYNYWINNVASPAMAATANSSINYVDAVAVLRAFSHDAHGVHQELITRGIVPPDPVVTEAAKVEAKGTDTAHADKVAQSRTQKVQTAPVVQQAPNPNTQASGSSLSSRIGDRVDIEDPTVAAIYEEAFKKYSTRRT